MRTQQCPLLLRWRAAASSSSPVCHCEWRRTGWCAASWSPWRCPGDVQQRRSCCSVPEWTWWCTKQDTRMTSKKKKPWSEACSLLNSTIIYSYNKTDRYLNQLVSNLHCLWRPPPFSRCGILYRLSSTWWKRKRYEVRKWSVWPIFLLNSFSLRLLIVLISHHDTSEASLATVSSVGLKSRALLSKPSSSAILSAPYRSPYFFITCKQKPRWTKRLSMGPIWFAACVLYRFDSNKIKPLTLRLTNLSQ